MKYFNDLEFYKFINQYFEVYLQLVCLFSKGSLGEQIRKGKEFIFFNYLVIE